MKFIPAIDLKDNKCVRLRKGKEEDLTIFNNNPVEQAIFFEKNGCKRIHVVDLDGAFGRSDINKKRKGSEAAKACIAMLINKSHG